MAELDQKTFFNGLGFLAVILSNVPADKQAQRALAIAKLIENFCTIAATDEAKTPATAKDSAAVIAKLFTSLMNDNQKNQAIVRDAMDALAQCQNAASENFIEIPSAPTGEIA